MNDRGDVVIVAYMSKSIYILCKCLLRHVKAVFEIVSQSKRNGLYAQLEDFEL